ncbi:MAG: ZPR1 zinc finger domain-containing protein [Candidatus Sigynarchaeota archaeon]
MFDSRTLFENVDCPSCGKPALSQKVHFYKEPRSKDEMLFFITLCEACAFKKTEIMPVAPSTHAKSNHYRISIKDPKDLEIKIFRASTGSIEIPELEIKLEPGPSAEFFITNIERILLKFKESCQFLLRNDPEPSAKEILEKRIRELDECLAVKREFTVLIDDQEGFSYVLPPNQNLA